MAPIASFAAAAATWQNFYILVGTAAATLIGLMFVAVTFGSSLVTPETATSTRAFLDPIFSHFVQVLLTACLITIPTMGPTLLGALLLAISTVRGIGLVHVFRHMLNAQRTHHDLELSDWLTGAALPLACYLLLAATGGGFLAGYAVAFSALAVVTVATMTNAVFGAWELLVWMAVARARTK